MDDIQFDKYEEFDELFPSFTFQQTNLEVIETKEEYAHIEQFLYKS